MNDAVSSEVSIPEKASVDLPKPEATPENSLAEQLEGTHDSGQAIRELAQSSEDVPKSISGKELPEGWPKILTPEDEMDAYDAMYEEGDDRSLPPKNPQIVRLSYELKNADKRLRYFAVMHQRDMKGPDDPNTKQYDVLEQQFNASPPQLVLYEGIMDGKDRQLTREEAIQLGEPAFMLYLVQQHNGALKDGESRIEIESGDEEFNNQPDKTRDPSIVKNIARNFEKYNKVDVVFGSGHAIREKNALGQFFETPTEEK